MSKSLTKDIARVVRGILAQRQMSQQDLALALGYSKSSSSVSRWLKGGAFDTDTMEAIAEALGLDAEILVRLALLSRDVNDGEMAALLDRVSRRSDPPSAPGSESHRQIG